MLLKMPPLRSSLAGRWPGTRSARWTGALGATLATVGLFWFCVPVVRFDAPLSTVILDKEGELLGASIATDGQWRFGPGPSVPSRFVTAITRFEDRRFFVHPGVDAISIVRAVVQNVRSGRVVSGGSTLTMQVVRLSRRDRSRSCLEKAIEAVLALRLELGRSKAQILALYAAYAPMGGNTVGLDAAAWRYFGHDASRLSWGETATLAVLPNAPALIHPGRNRDLLLAKRNRLLDSLREARVLDETACRLAKLEPLPPAPRPLPMLAPHVLARAQAESAARSFLRGASRPWVRTTLDISIQRRAREVVARHQRVLEHNGVHNAAALILEVETGAAVVYVGNTSDPADAGVDHGQHVDVIRAPRSTGSILKPLLFAAMLEAGEVLPGQLIPDVPTHLGLFNPENFDRSYSGAVPAERALARSLNVPAVRMLRSYGVDRFCSLLRRLGLTTLHRSAEDYGLALILGGAEGTLWDVTNAYAGLARAARSAPVFRTATYLAGSGPAGASRRDIAPLHAGAAYLTLQAMLEVERPGEDVAWRAFGSSRKIAWKTGTSYGFRDAWAVGVTPRYAVGVWAGNADGEGRPGLTGYSAAAPLLFELFDLLPDREWFLDPGAELVDIDVCAQSGMRLGPHCQRSRPQLVTPAGLGAPPCSFCRLVHSDRDATWQVHADCEPVGAIRTRPWFVLPPVMEVYYRRHHADYEPPPPLRPDCRGALEASGDGSLSCVYPTPNAEVYVPIEMDGKLGRVVFEAAHRDPAARVFWHVDEEYYGETRDIHQLALAPPPGRHVLTLVDATGESMRRVFTVRGQRPDPSGVPH
jgi:penicillin-binding protein 1C